jgi:predicted O-linked N-acetylglucosamine transferase (SPINDLY family)
MLTQATLQTAFALHQRGQLAQAQALYEDVLRAEPNNFEALHHLGLVFCQRREFARGLKFFDRAIKANPQSADCHSNRGNALRDLGRLDEAIPSFDKALALRPDFAEGHCNRGNTLRDLRRLEAAIASYDKAVALQPDLAEAWSNRGAALHDLERLEEAVASYDKAVALKPNHAKAWSNRGNALRALKRIDDAIASYDKAVALEPNGKFALGDLLLSRLQVCDWQGFAQGIARLSEKIARREQAAAPFVLLATVDEPALHRQAAELHAQSTYPAIESAKPLRKSTKRDKIHIGYYSADFHEHPTAWLMAELIEQHDRQRFEVTAFSFGPDRQDAMRQRLSSAFDRFIDVRQKSDAEIAAMSRDLRIDVAVDLKGYTDDCRTNIFAQRCAPLQVNYLGYPGTMGAPYIDYIFADRTVIPEGAERHYTEKVVRLPGCYQANDSRRTISDRVFTRQECGLGESDFVFCCFNNTYKIQPATFDGWMRILAKVPRSKLWLFESNALAAENLRRQAASRGIDGDRLVFAAHLPLADHLARHRCADLFLDTLPYNAHTTASDALWAGVPVLTRAGEAFAGRVAASLLTVLGLSELVTLSEQEFEERAIELATNPGKLADIRQKLRDNRLSSGLFNGAAFARHIEAAYTAIHRRHQTGQPPAHLTLPP